MSITFAENGDTVSTVDSKDHKQDGWTRSYYPGNKLSSEVQFKEGYEDGKDIAYFENGRIKYEGENKLGVKTGNWYLYSEQGSLLRIEQWDRGKLQNAK